MKRDFETWLASFRLSISPYSYYVDFDTVYQNAEKYKVELNILNSLIWSKDIKSDFIKLINEYPKVLQCVPTLLAVRQSEIFVLDESWKELLFDFKKKNYSSEDFAVFMEKTWLFDLFQNHLINNCYDYVLWVECWLNSNARKNRWWHLMEDLVEKHIVKAWFVKDESYFKEMYLTDIEKKRHVDLSAMSGNNVSTKRFDFVVKTENQIYVIETNFYGGTGGGSKLNETARSYKMLTQEAKLVNWVTFVRFTDWTAWRSARKNLEETFNELETIYNIKDLENWIMKEVFK